MTDRNKHRADRGLRLIQGHNDFIGGGINLETAAIDTITDVLHGLLREQGREYDAAYTTELVERAFHTYMGDREDAAQRVEP